LATVNEIMNIDSYVGNAALGGANEIAINIDTKPIQQLAAYTLMYNKSQYDQRQKDADEKIKELGKLTKFDAINGLPKDVDAVKAAKLKLQELSTKFASEIPGSPKQKQESWLKFQQEKAEVEKLLNSANARDIKLKAYIDATQIDKDLTTEQKELNIKEAQKLFDETDVFTLPVIPETKITTPKVGAPVYDEVQYFKEDASGNMVIDETRNEYSFTGNAKMGYLEANDLIDPTLPANATEQQKAEYEQKKLAFKQSKMGGWKTATQFLGDAFNNPNYKKTVTTTGINVMGAAPTTALAEEVDVEKIKATNPLAGGIIQLGEAYNDAIQKKIERLEKQQYDNSITGKKPLFTQGQDTPENLKKLLIDVTKPLSPEQLVALARFEQARPDKVDMKLIQTDNAIQRENNLLDYKVQWKNAETARINALKKDGGSGSSAKPETVISQPAILFGEHINRLKSTFQKNNNQPIIIPFKSVDEKTRVATKLKDKEYIVYKPDGSYIITTDKEGVDNKKTVSVGTIDNLAQGFIDAVKTIDLDATKDKDGTMAEGFQVKSEAFFNQTFGTASGKTIWDNWNAKAPATTTTTTPANKPAGTTMSDEEYKKFLQANGL